MESKGRSPNSPTTEAIPCPVCRGEGVERRWRYDERASVLEETSRTCSFCGGSGRCPPRVDVRPGEATPGWAWEIGNLA